MSLQNLHTHTVFGDGKSTAEEMALGAIRAGCGSLGFSEHSHLPPAIDPDGYTLAADSVPAYRREVLRLREKYAGELEILLGLEQDIDSTPPEDVYDYVIGSVHGVWKDGVYLPVDDTMEKFAQAVTEYYGGDALGLVRDYYRRAAEVHQRTGCQIIGHFDLVTKFNQKGGFFDEEGPRYLDIALAALEPLAKQDVIFEINTGAMSRGYRTAPYPGSKLLRAIRKLGGRVCITSDSHSAATVTYAFGQAAELALACGFREAIVLAPTGFQQRALPAIFDDYSKQQSY